MRVVSLILWILISPYPVHPLVAQDHPTISDEFKDKRVRVVLRQHPIIDTAWDCGIHAQIQVENVGPQLAVVDASLESPPRTTLGEQRFELRVLPGDVVERHIEVRTAPGLFDPFKPAEFALTARLEIGGRDVERPLQVILQVEPASGGGERICH